MNHFDSTRRRVALVVVLVALAVTTPEARRATTIGNGRISVVLGDRGVATLTDISVGRTFKLAEDASPEVPRRERRLAQTLEMIRAGCEGPAGRRSAVRAACRSGCSLSAIARFLGVHDTTVSRMMTSGLLGSDLAPAAQDGPDPHGLGRRPSAD